MFLIDVEEHKHCKHVFYNTIIKVHTNKYCSFVGIQNDLTHEKPNGLGGDVMDQ